METKNFHRKICLIFGMTFLATVFAFPVQAAEKRKVVIGYLGHMTGAYAAGQAGVMEGHLDCIKFLNAKNYVPGVELEGIWVDGGTDVAKSMAGFKKMMANKPEPVAIHAESTGIGLALKKWYIKESVPSIEAGSDDEFGRLPSWTFSPPCPYPNMCGAWIDYYLKHIWKEKGRKPRFAWLTWDNPFGRSSITDKVKKHLESKGVEIVGEEFIPGVPTDVTPQLLRLKEKGADFTFGGMYAEPLSVVLKDADKLGMVDSLVIGMAYAATPENLLKYSGDKTRNVYAIVPAYPSSVLVEKSPLIMASHKENKRENFFPSIYAHGFALASVAVEGVRIAASEVGPAKIDGMAVYNALQKIKHFDAFGSFAPITFGSKKRFGQDEVILTAYRDNKVVSLGVIPAPDLTVKFE